MDPVAVGKALVDLGGWAAFVVTVVAATIGIATRKIVPGWAFDKEEKRADAADARADALTAALKELTAEVRFDARDRLRDAREQRDRA